MTEAALAFDAAVEPPLPPFGSYRTDHGRMIMSTLERALDDGFLNDCLGRTNLVFTSPPFPLTSPKRYGNKTGEEYLEWLKKLAPRLVDLLAPDGSIVVEIGNAWERGTPTMSTLPIRALLAFVEDAELHVCQQFICHNPARLPGPAQWVTIERIRIKDSYTHVWWIAKTGRPKADNRSVLTPYSGRMKQLLRRKGYNTGPRPSGHVMREGTFLKDNGGAIPSSVLEFSNTGWNADYLAHCRRLKIKPHPARMQPGLVEFFVKFLTTEGDLVVDPFAGSNTTGAMAESLKRRWVSVEPCRDYLRGSRGRFASSELIRLG